MCFMGLKKRIALHVNTVYKFRSYMVRGCSRDPDSVFYAPFNGSPESRELETYRFVIVRVGGE